MLDYFGSMNLSLYQNTVLAMLIIDQHSIHFSLSQSTSSIWLDLVYFSALRSILVQFSLLRSTLVQSGPFSLLRSILLYLVNFSPIWSICSTLIQFVPFSPLIYSVQFGPYDPLRSIHFTSVYSIQIDPLWSIWSI